MKKKWEEEPEKFRRRTIKSEGSRTEEGGRQRKISGEFSNKMYGSKVEALVEVSGVKRLLDGILRQLGGGWP